METFIGFDAIVSYFRIMVSNLKLFPFNFLWCTVPAILCSGINNLQSSIII